jgi:SAM-dependent methyltransferase
MFPTNVYTAAWKTFRQSSNENEVTAETILSFQRWRNRNDGISILDIGCGDGLLIQEIVRQLCSKLGFKIKFVTLLDPYTDWLEEARVGLRPLKDCGDIPELYVINKGIEQNLNLLTNHDVILAIHLVYLLEEGVFEHLLKSLKPTVRFYAVMDAPGSVFSEIWSKTKPNYLAKVEHAHELVKSLGADYTVNKKTVLSKVDNPLKMEDSGIKKMIFSMLSYSNYEDLSNEERDHISSEIDKQSNGNRVSCESICYEIFKK